MSWINTLTLYFLQDWNDDATQTLCTYFTKQQEINNGDPIRGILLVLQGGIHFGTDLNRYKEGLVTFIQQPGFQTWWQNKWDITIIWTTYNYQSQSLDDKYPHQSREGASDFKEHIISYLQEKPFPVYIIDQHNLTMDAQTSEGFHYLRDVNLLNVYLIVHVSTRIKEEQEVQWKIHLKATLNQTEELSTSGKGS